MSRCRPRCSYGGAAVSAAPTTTFVDEQQWCLDRAARRPRPASSRRCVGELDEVDGEVLLVAAARPSSL